MAHNHSYDDKTLSERNIRTAFFLNICFTVVEIAGGFLTNSMAIMADALHDFGDSLALGLSWYFAKLSGRKPTDKFSYGFKRFSLLAALINGVILLGGSLLILSKAIPRIINPEHSNAQGMLVLALIGVVVNGVAAWKLKSGKTMNERMVTWHLLEDVLGWVAVLIISVVMLIRDIHILDPILSILITLYILWNVVKNLKKTVTLFLQGVPESVSVEYIAERIRDMRLVKDVHDIHIWSLDGENNILTAHIIVDAGLSQNKACGLKAEIKKKLHDIGIQHATIEVEMENEDCIINHH